MTSIDNIRIGTPVRTKDRILLPIERTSIVHDSGQQGGWCHASKQLFALVVRSATGIQAFDLETGPIAISELENAVPELKARLRQHGFT